MEGIIMMELIKFNRPKQFPKDEILNEKDRLVRSWMTVEVTDSQGDIVPIDQVKRVMNTWFKRGATMIDQHTNRPIGKGLRWQEGIEPESKKPGVLLDYQVFDDYSIDDQVWEEIKNGDRTGLSIGGRATGKPRLKEDDYTGSTGKYLQGLELYEVSPVDNPANQLGKNVAINYLAKSMNGAKKDDIKKQLMKDLEKGYAGDMEEQFGGFKNFDDCVEAQKCKGHSDDSAKRVCGLMIHETEKRFFESKTEKKKGKTIEDYNWDPDMDNIAHIGYMVESEEHPQLDEKGVKQIVVDHLSEDPTYYDKKKAGYLTKPFAGYSDFADCVAQNSDKDNPKAYCATIHQTATGKWPSEKNKADDQTFKPGEKVLVGPFDSNRYQRATIVREIDVGNVEVQYEDGNSEVTDKDNVNYAIKKKTEKVQKSWPDNFVKSLNEVKKSPETWPGEFVKQLQNQKV
jgi:hypothetical protein